MIAQYSIPATLPHGMFQTFYHFVGATSGSTDLYRLLVRLWQDMLPANDTVPTDFNDLKYSLATVLRKAADTATKRGQKRVVVLIDALNQMDDTGWPQHLASLLNLIVLSRLSPIICTAVTYFYFLFSPVNRFFSQVNRSNSDLCIFPHILFNTHCHVPTSYNNSYFYYWHARSVIHTVTPKSAQSNGFAIYSQLKSSCIRKNQLKKSFPTIRGPTFTINKMTQHIANEASIMSWVFLM